MTLNSTLGYELDAISCTCNLKAGKSITSTKKPSKAPTKMPIKTFIPTKKPIRSPSQKAIKLPSM